MPFISVSAAGKLTPEQKTELKKGLGECITLIPGKTEKALMVDLTDGHTLYMGGNELENGAFVEVRMYKDAEFTHKKAVTEAIFALLERVCGMTAKQVYITFDAYDEWGTKGSLY